MTAVISKEDREKIEAEAEEKRRIEAERREAVRQKYLPKPKKNRKRRVRCGRSSNLKFAQRLHRLYEKRLAFRKWLEEQGKKKEK